VSFSSLSGRVAALIAATVVLAVLLLGWFVLLSPQRSKVSTLDGQIADTQTQIASTQAYVSNPATKKSIAQLARLKRLLPDDVHMSQVLRQLSAAAAAAGVRLNTITPSAPAFVGTGQAAPIQLSLEGHYGGLSNFLHLLRTQARVVGDDIKGKGRLYSVSGIQFGAGSASASGGGASTITATVSLNVFLNGSVAAAPATPTTTTP
jgi:Tfp pilus assembly protein PilO